MSRLLKLPLLCILLLLAPLGWLILPVMGYLALISGAYLFSRFEPFLAHLNNSAERLILQAVPLVGCWLIGQSIALGWVREKSKIVNDELPTGRLRL